MAEPMTTGWHYLKGGASDNRRVGPLTWDELHDLAASGSLWPIDLVWHPSLPQWFQAGEVPGLFPTTAPSRVKKRRRRRPAAVRGQRVDGAAATGGTAAVYQPSWTGHAPHRRSWLLPFVLPLATLVVLGCGAAAYFTFWHDSSGGRPERIDLGVNTVTRPDPARLIDTVAWGEVPADQIGVVLADGSTRSTAEEVATALGGAVVGEIEFIDAYQIETDGATEADLRATLEQAAALRGVESAFPNLQTTVHTELRGTRSSPLGDPVYGAGRSAGLELIGAQKAWDYIQGSGLPLSAVHVGLVDTGIYKGTREFSGDVKIRFPDKSAGESASPAPLIDPQTGEAIPDPTGGHGTMLSGMVGADPDNGATTGLASSVLGSLLTLSMIDLQAGEYGTGAQSIPNQAEPSEMRWIAGRSYAFGDLVAIAREVEAGAQIINCSWGNDKDHPSRETAALYRRFFEKMSTEHAGVLFVCSAGNDGGPADGSRRFPGGMGLPNMITVGDVMNDGTRAEESNMTNAIPGREYEVTMAAPGYQAVQGVDSEGAPLAGGTAGSNGITDPGGTSMAAAQVSAAAALLLSLNPGLSAAETKRILSETARPGPTELGGKTLAVDQAVLEVINEERARLGLPQLAADELQKGGVIDAVAVTREERNTWLVKAIIEVLPSPKGTEVTIAATEGSQIVGHTTQKVTAPREIAWVVMVVPETAAAITVTRTDNGASAVITFEPTGPDGVQEQQ